MPNDAITPFILAVPQADLEDLNRRIDQTRWPDAETVDDWSPERVLALKCGDRLNRVCATDRLRSCFRQAEVLHLTLLDELLHRSRHFFDRHVQIDTMNGGLQRIGAETARYSARTELCRRLCRLAEACTSYEKALALVWQES